VVESAPNAIVIIGPDGLVEMVNAQTERMFGYSRNDLLGKPVEMLVPERYRPNHRARAAARHAGCTVYTEVQVPLVLCTMECDGAAILASLVRLTAWHVAPDLPPGVRLIVWTPSPDDPLRGHLPNLSTSSGTPGRTHSSGFSRFAPPCFPG